MGKGSSVLSPLPTASRHARLLSLWRRALPISTDISSQPLLQAEQLQELSDTPTPPKKPLTPPGHFNCNPELKVFIKFSLSPASSSVRSAACRPDRRSSEEHLQFKRDAYATAVSGLKVNRLLRHPGPSLPRRVSGVFYIPLFEMLRFLPGFLPARSAQLLQGLARRLGKLGRSCPRTVAAGERAGATARQTMGSFPRLLVAKPRERMTATAALLARSWQMVLSLFLLISNVMTFPFKNTDVARAATGAPLWEEHNVCCCSHSPPCICSYLRRWFHAPTVLSRSSGSRWNLCLG